MSITRHHAEWQSLVEVSGPFLSMAVLERFFPQGIDDVDSEVRDRLRLAHEEWLDAEAVRFDRAMHFAWVRLVFREALGFDERDILQDSPLLRVPVPEHHDTLTATFALKNPDGRDDAGRPRVLVSVIDPARSPDKPLPDSLLKAAPVDRMLLLLRGLQAQGTSVRLGLVTNGAEWVMIHVAPNETTTYVRWTSELWFDEPLTLRAFITLLSAHRLFGVPDEEVLEALIAASAKDAQEVTVRLGAQVRRATEVLVQTIDRLDRERGGKLLEGISPVTLYEASVTVMMRLVFLLAAEERKLLLLGVPVYDQHYALSTLHDQLQSLADRHGEEVLERRYDAWSRLLGTFRAVFAGVEHTDLRLPAYGGSLFNPDRFPFLEGRLPGTKWEDPAQKSVPPLAIDSRTALHLLRAITRLEVKAGGGRTETRRLSFRALDVEQIGHVYEGLLDHTARRAEDVVLSLAGSEEPEIEIAELEARKKDEGALLKWLEEETGRGASALKKALAYKPQKDDERQLLMACENTPALYKRVLPWAGLVRNDTHGTPVVIPKGSVYVTEGSDRRSTGTHYTPRILTEPIVRHTLEPLVYEGPAEGRPREEWRLRTAKEILDLRVCDLAMGSGAFLVQACRFLSERLVEAWEAEEKRLGTNLILAPDGRLSSGEARERAVPTDAEERLVMARRFVADRCLYGVDKNPWAVEMAKLSLWLTTMQKGRPFTFLDHALRTGDSLLGITHEDQLLYFHLDPARGKKLHDNLVDLHGPMKKALARAREIREKLEDFATDDIKDAWQKEFLLNQAQDATAELRVVGHLIIGAALSTATRGDKAFDDLLTELSVPVQKMLSERDPGERKARQRELKRKAHELLNSGREERHATRSTLHWAIEFPEVMGRGGFHAFVGNPPFMGGLKLETAFGRDYRAFIVRFLAGGVVGVRGTADLCSYFALRYNTLCATIGYAGFLATKTLSEGDSREVGLSQIIQSGTTIMRAVRRKPWPGEAGVDISEIWLARRSWNGTRTVDERPCTAVSDRLEPVSANREDAKNLSTNEGIAFAGTNPMGPGFVLNLDEAAAIISREPREEAVIKDYFIGKDLNELVELQAPRKIIDFRNWGEEQARLYKTSFRLLRERVFPFRQAQDKTEQPQRWWVHGGPRLELYRTISGMRRVLAVCQTSKYFVFRWLGTNAIFSTKAVVFAVQEDEWFGLLQSSLHTEWAILHGSSLSITPVYTPVKCFGTFPRPDSIERLRPLGREMYVTRDEAFHRSGTAPTAFYNLVHDPNCRDAAVARLRELICELDIAVLQAYSWDNLKLDHGFHETKQGLRFTISEAARMEILDRLLELNHRRYAEEVKAGLHSDDKKQKNAPAKKAAPAPAPKKPSKKGGGKSQLNLLGDEED